jgi:competence protein ComEC
MRDRTFWLGLAACAGALAVAAPIETAIAAIAVGALLLIVRERAIAVIAALVFLLGFARAELRIRAFERARIVDVGPVRRSFEGTVVKSPAQVGSGLRVDIDADRIGRVTVYTPDGEPARGDRVAVTASLAPPYRFWNDGSGDPRPMSARRGTLLTGGADDFVVLKRGRGVGAVIDHLRARLRRRIVATFPAETAPMARALVLGEEDLAVDDEKAFRKSGLAHLLAVSGMHLVLVVMGLVAAIRAVILRIPAIADRWEVGRIASAIGIPIAWLYADLAGASGSAIRAAWMCTVVLLARALGRRPHAARALGLSLLAMAAVDPLVAFDVSFVLSALATAGLLVLSPAIERWLRDRKTPVIVAKPIATTAAATIACAPVIATIAPDLPLGGLLANVIAVPLGEAAALPLCLLHGLLEAWPSAERGCAVAASGALVLVRLVARGFAWTAIPVPQPTNAQLAVLAATAAAATLLPMRWPAHRLTDLFLRRVSQRAALLVGALVVVALEMRARAVPHGVLRATFIDVGQGDAALIDLPNGEAMLIDGGGLVGSPIDVGERAVAPVLAARRRTRLAAVILSHPHPDHFLGLVTTLGRVRASELWDTGEGAESPAYAAVKRSVQRIRGPPELCGAHAIGGAIVEVLAPCPGPTPDADTNDNSFVIRVRYGARAFLFVGDAERAEEATLRTVDVRADVLKVGHHGSRTSSSPAFLARVHPAIGVISCGIRNRFGHPHPTTLEHLSEAGIRTYRTDRNGSVIVSTDGRDVQVRSTTPM